MVDHSPCRHAVRAALAAGLLLALLAPVTAQQQGGQGFVEDAPPAAAAAESATPRESPGFIDAIARFFTDPGAQWRGARDTAGAIGNRAQEVAKDAASSVVRLPSTRVVGGRAKCAVAANGAPDCASAAEAVCRSHNMGGGRSLDIQTAEDCPARAYLSGRSEPGLCKTSTYVTRAVCQ